jgi:cell division septation protein DedD
MNDETETRRQSTGRGRRGGISRAFLVAGALILFGGAYLFWPRGGGQDHGIGERYSVVTASNDGSPGTESLVRSGEVSIEEETLPAVPETEQGATQAEEPSVAPASGQTGEAAVEPTAAKPAAAEPAAKKPPAKVQEATSRVTGATSRQEAEATHREPVPQPLGARGAWQVQVGAFGDPDNAERLVTHLRALGYQVEIHEASRSDGGRLHRVCVGSFGTREEAARFATQHGAELGDQAIPVRR